MVNRFLAAGLIVGAAWVSLGLQRTSTAQGVLPSASEVRFELIGNEPIAGPDGRALVKGWSVLMFRDRRSDQCYVVFKQGDAITAEAGAACPE